MEWTKDAVKALIEAYREESVLVDVEHDLYHNKYARKEALEAVTKKVAKIFPAVTAGECKNKFAVLRSHYGAELKKIRQSEKSGCSSTTVYKPKVWWFPLLTFLRDFIAPRKGHSNISCNVIPAPTTAAAATTTTNFDTVSRLHNANSNGDGLSFTTSVVESPDFSLDGMEMLVVDNLDDAQDPVIPGSPSAHVVVQEADIPGTSSVYAEATQSKKRKKTDGNPLLNTVLHSLNSKLSECQQVKSPNEGLGQFIVQELDKIKDKKIQRVTKHRILQILMEGQVEDENN